MFSVTYYFLARGGVAGSTGAVLSGPTARALAKGGVARRARAVLSESSDHQAVVASNAMKKSLSNLSRISERTNGGTQSRVVRSAYDIPEPGSLDYSEWMAGFSETVKRVEEARLRNIKGRNPH
jgi:hypothetical protein